MLAQPELEARRWDGYRGLVAPQLLGSWNWPGALLQAGPETRMCGAMDGLLNRLPFWYSVRRLHHSKMYLHTRVHACVTYILSCVHQSQTDVTQKLLQGRMRSMGPVKWIEAAILP